MEAFDKDGNAITVFSQEELDAKAKEVSDAAVSAALEEHKKSNPPASDDDGKDDEIPAWAKPLFDNVETLRSNNTQSHLAKVTAGIDTDKRNEIEAKFKDLSGYAETAEGMSRRAEDAYLLVTGSKFDAGTVDMSNLVGSGGGKSNLSSPQQTASDKNIQAALNITQADVEKFGKK